MTATNDRVNNIVLVHGALADGSGWLGLYNILKARGYRVSVVGNPKVAGLVYVSAFAPDKGGPHPPYFALNT